MEKAVWAGVSSAPKQGPQKAVLMETPASINEAACPFFINIVN
jgi:hypothetical protein